MQKLSFYKNLFENLTDMIVITDHSTQMIVDCNQVLLDKLGYSRKEILGIPSALDLYHPCCRSSLKEALDICSLKGYCRNMDLMLQTKRGDQLPVSLVLSRTRDASKAFSFFRNVNREVLKPSLDPSLIEDPDALRDIASQVKDFQLKCQELERRNKDLDTFACLMTHDLRGPLRFMNSLTTLLKEDTRNKLSASSKNCLLSLQQIIHKMNILMNDIIFYFLVDKNSVPFESLNIRHFLKSIFEVMDIPQGFDFSLDTQVNQVSAKKLPLQQVLYNLFNNAIRHHHNPSQGRVSIRIHATPEDYIFQICDNGPGIPRQFHDHIFEPFKKGAAHQKGATTENGNQGTGLGLAIVQKIVAHESGKIVLYSCPKSGTTFLLRWPKMKHP